MQYLSQHLCVAGLTALWICAGVAVPSLAHSKKHQDTADPIGHPGEKSAVDRVINIELGDNFFRLSDGGDAPPRLALTVREGETIQFILRNTGEFVHEFNLGTAAMHAAHQTEMAKMMEAGVITGDKVDHSRMLQMGMSHDHSNSALLVPGATAELVWTFSTTGRFEFACNIPGHYETGMAGDVTVQR